MRRNNLLSFLVLALVAVCMPMNAAGGRVNNTQVAEEDACVAGTVPHQSAANDKVSELISKLKAENDSLQQTLLECYPDFGSISKINDKTVAKVVEDLSAGNMMDMTLSIHMDGWYANIKVNQWYIDHIKAASTADAKVALVEEYTELNELLRSLGIVVDQIWRAECWGGSMRNLSTDLEFFHDWLEVLQKPSHSKDRISADEALQLMDLLMRYWEYEFASIRNMIHESEYYDGRDLLEINDTVLNEMVNINSCMFNKLPYTWVDKAVRKSIKNMCSDSDFKM